MLHLVGHKKTNHHRKVRLVFLRLAGCLVSGSSLKHYWQASQSGSSMAQAFGTGAGPAACTGA
ncbi:hypothetical protein, partial [Pseudomonas sp.]|uniref:hypothetical protein n=1 Tax=Pseudomonas sp. TaxID=306 RepID=UPI0025874DA3